MTTMNHRIQKPTDKKTYDPFSLVLLLIAFVAIAVMLIGIATRGTTPWILIAPLTLASSAIFTLARNK